MSNETHDPAGSESPKTEPCLTPEELAAEAVRVAKMEWEKAQQYYQEIRQKTSQKIHDVCENVGDKKVCEVVSRTLETVKKYPGASLLLSTALGICVGRWIQRLMGK